MNKVPVIKKIKKVNTNNKPPTMRVQKNRIKKLVNSGNYKVYANRKVLNKTTGNYETKKYVTKDLNKAYKSLGAHSFPGKIKNSNRYADGVPGLFVTQVKGIKGKHFIEKGIKAALDAFESL